MDSAVSLAPSKAPRCSAVVRFYVGLERRELSTQANKPSTACSRILRQGYRIQAPAESPSGVLPNATTVFI